MLLLIGVPIAWCMGVASLLAIASARLGLPRPGSPSRPCRGADAITLAAIPLFLFAGELMKPRRPHRPHHARWPSTSSGASAAASAWSTSPRRMVYGGISGSATADTGAGRLDHDPGAWPSAAIPRPSRGGHGRLRRARHHRPQSVILILYGVHHQHLDRRPARWRRSSRRLHRRHLHADLLHRGAASQLPAQRDARRGRHHRRATRSAPCRRC